LPWVVLALVLACGAWLRLADLGRNTFGTDEMNHFYVGQSIDQGKGPVLPSGSRYTRGLNYSQMVAAVLPHSNRPEFAVRAPAAILGILALGVFALLAWTMAGPWAAVIATALLAIYPEGLRLSRYGRFYTLQLLAALVGMYAGWRVLRYPLSRERMNRDRVVESWVWALLALACLGYAADVQVTTLSVIAGFGIAIAAAGGYDLWREGRAAWRWSVPLQLTIVGLVAGLVLLATQFGNLEALFWQARTMPLWARLSAEGEGSPAVYYRALSQAFPIVISLSPLIFLVTIIRSPRAGTFLLLWFVVPLLLHSFVFAWKLERYVLAAIPALLLAAGIAASMGLALLQRFVARTLERLPAGMSGPLAAGVTLLVALTVLLTLPAFNESRRMVTLGSSAGWLETQRMIHRDSALQSLPLGNASPLAALHYWGRLDFVVQRGLLEGVRRDSTSRDFNRPYLYKRMGSPDAYAGRPTLTTPDAIRTRFAGRPAVLIGVDQKYLKYRNIEPSLQHVLATEARELCQGKCGSMLLYYWPLKPSS
jgi:hypothetical protein